MKSLLQTQNWTSFKEKFGWKSHQVDNVFILEKSLPWGKNFFYIPEITQGQYPLYGIKNLIRKIERIKNKGTIFLRIEPLSFDKAVSKLFQNWGFRPAFEEIQPWHRQWVSVEPSPDEILAQMKPKGRYNIKIAQKHGVEVKKSRDINIFYKLYQETYERIKFVGRQMIYFEEMTASLGNWLEIYIAYYKNKPVAGVIASFYNIIASYLYGASSSLHRNVMAPYLIHWQVIQDAKARGCQIYDLLAVAPQDNIHHKHAGITRFKKQFGGKQIDLVGGWDLVFQPLAYALFKYAEKIRRR